MFSITHLIQLRENQFWIKLLGIGKYIREESKWITGALKYMVVSCNDFDTIFCYHMYNEFEHKKVRQGFRIVWLTVFTHMIEPNLLYHKKVFTILYKIREKLKRNINTIIKPSK